MLLKDVSHISAGHSFRGKVPELIGSGIHAVQLKNASPKGIDWHTCFETTITGKASPKFLEPDDILFVARGGHNYAVLIDQHINSIQAVAAPHFYVIKVNASIILPQFLAWLLNQQPIQQYYQREAEGTLAKSIRRSVLEHTPITLPSMDKQHKIAQLVTTLRQEQYIHQQLIDNGTKLMNAIASQLLHGNPHKETA